MKRPNASLALLLLLLLDVACQQTQAPAPTAEKASTPAPTACNDCVRVTVENFPRAETDLYFAAVATKQDGFGKFM